MSDAFACKATPSLGPTTAHGKPCRTAKIVQIRPRGLARSPVPEETREPLPSWSSDVFGTALASCRRMILGLQAWHALRALNDHQLCDIGLSRDQIRPPLLTALTANRHLERW